ncbi:uncharacterized protein LOC128994127 [Macrosteles quadrilineatus]|uniref:uncharacterized protein LOC128994127 n=1 Tax=Macrosteles quadrilineatus TaxID=74068 RepID=UPI0023E20CED|nr:uncharacterized protein LOC128994127 [Macrosteles quadrilineatus]
MSESSFALFNEESSITGGKSVSEIVQILRTNASLKLKVRDLDDHEDVEEVPNRTSQIFPWIKRFTAQCKDVILDPNIRKLDELISTFFRHIDDTAKQCYKRPKRAYKLKTRISSFLQTFNMIYNQLKQPLEHTCYLEKMSDVMAVYIDIELKSSRRGREHPKKIAERICTSLFIFLDKSIEHILDTVLKSKFFIKKYSEICCPIMARVLRERPGRLYEASYIRYILSFKLWKKLAGKDHYATINKEAVTKLTPPPDFTEKLKTGLFSNVLPYVSKSEKDRITLFFMQSPFNVKKKAQVFLKEEKKMQPNLDLERSLLFDDDLQISFLDDDNDDSNEQPDDDLMNDMWNNLVDNEEDCFDSLLIPMDIIETKEDEDIIVDLKRTKGNEKPKKTLKDRPTNGVLKTSLKKRKVTKPNNNTLMKNFSGKDAVMDFIRNDLTIPITSVSTKEDNPIVSCVKSEDSLVSFINSPEMKQPKPCATVEPEQCREITDSVKNFTEVSPVRAPRNPTISMAEPSGQEPTVTKAGEESCETDDKVEYIEAIPSTTVSSNLEDTTIVENFVAEEVVIGSDIEQDSGCSFLFLDTDSKMVQNDILSVIGITKGSTSFCNAEIVVNEESIMKDDRRQIVIDSTVLNDSNVIKTKENVSGSPDNQFLYSITPSTESYVPFSRRQDSYACNDMFLQRLLSDPTPVDDGSDDDSRYQDRRRFAGGGKLPAFREQTEESKSENDEDFDALTPSSDSLQQSPLDTSLESTRLQQEALESTPPSPRDVDPHPQDKKEKTLNQEDPKLSQMKELTIPLSRGEVLTANDQVCDVSEDKIRPPGKRSSSRYSSSRHGKKKVATTTIEELPGSDDEPLFNLERQTTHEDKSDDDEIKTTRRSKTKTVSSSRSKSKTRQPSPSPPKLTPQPVVKKRRSKRRR